MRVPATTARLALHARLTHPAQEAPLQPEGDLPPYMESFLAHLRLLVGVPFEYLVPDDRMLPPESIRFFYLDRSWTDRVVDGAVAVGQIGSREEAHYQARAAVMSQRLDQSERMVQAAAARHRLRRREGRERRDRHARPRWSPASCCGPARCATGRTWTSARTTRTIERAVRRPPTQRSSRTSSGCCGSRCSHRR